MNTTRWLRSGVVVITVLSFCTLSSAASKDKMKKEEAPTVEQAAPAAAEPAAAAAADPQAEMMAKMQEAGTPNENHKMLEPMVGTFEHTSKWWKAPGSEPEVSTGMTDSKWILGGRFVEGTVTGTMMGQPFEGKSIIGYDNVKKEYTSIWIDNMMTGIMTSSSTYDAATKTFAEAGEFSCPIMGPNTKFRGAIKINDENSYVYEMFMTDPEGKEMKTMEITYTRKPAA